MGVSDGWLVVICIVAVFVGAILGFGLSQDMIERDCEKLGKVMVNGKVYECSKVQS